jgi:hypothetical protein
LAFAPAARAQVGDGGVPRGDAAVTAPAPAPAPVDAGAGVDVPLAPLEMMARPPEPAPVSTTAVATAMLATPAPAETEPPRPITRRLWFWMAITGVLVGAVLIGSRGEEPESHAARVPAGLRVPAMKRGALLLVFALAAVTACTKEDSSSSWTCARRAAGRANTHVRLSAKAGRPGPSAGRSAWRACASATTGRRRRRRQRPRRSAGRRRLRAGQRQRRVPALKAGATSEPTKLFIRALPANGCVPDAGTDAGEDAGTDAGTDAGADAPDDTGTDAGDDAGTDVNTDAGDDGVDAVTADASDDAGGSDGAVD